MKELIITYIIIVILQLVYSIYVPLVIDKKNVYLNNHLITEPTKEIKICEFIKSKLIKLMESANKMKYSDWINYVKKNSLYEFDGIKMYVFNWTNINNTDKMMLVNYPDKKLEELTWEDFLQIHDEIILNSKYTLSKNIPLNMYNNAIEGHYDLLSYYWIDPIYEKSVRKKTLFTKFYFKKENISGVIGIGINIENLSNQNQFKYFNYISKPELIIGSLISITISLVISKLHTVKNAQIKAFIFLIIINLYIIIFNNTQDHISKIANENEKITTINSNILNLSFLSSVNLFILSTIYTTNKDLFVETSVIFILTVLLLLMAIYKLTNQNTIYELIKVRLTNTFIFNYAVLLNIIIITNFIFYTFSKRFKGFK